MKNKYVSSFLRKIFFLCIAIAPLSAQHITTVRKPTGVEDWYILKQAQNAYEMNDYGQALKFAESAKQKRRQMAEWEVYVLDQTQKNSRVRKSGDYLDDVMPELKTANLSEALGIIEAKLSAYGKNHFHNKFSEICKWIENDDIYPEADFLIGKIYKLEGELELASKYLNNAYENLIRLDVPDVKYDILYELASLADLQDDGEAYEKQLLAVLKDDKLYTNSGFRSALVRLINANQKDSVDKFFILYRSTNDISIKALELLNEYYTKIGQNEKALDCAALGSIASVTKIEEVLKDRLIDYSYTDFADLLTKAAMYDDIVTWGNENGIWKLFYNFASTSAVCGKDVFARTLLRILSEHEPEAYWRQRAVSKLQ